MRRWIGWLLLLVGCVMVTMFGTLLVVTLIVPTPTAVPSPRATESATPTTTATALPPTATPTRTATPTQSVTPAPTVPLPTLTPLPATALVSDLRPPVLVDGESGRLYAAGTFAGTDQILALACSDGRTLAAYAITGTFAVDGSAGWLYVDRGDEGLAIVDVHSGAVTAVVPLPAADVVPPAPLASSKLGLALAFRGAQVHFVNPANGRVSHVWQTDVQPAGGSCGTSAGPLPILGAVLDDAANILYLEYLTYVCTPHTGYTIVAYDVNRGEEIDRTGGAGPTGQATAYNGVLYGSSWNRMGSGHRWQWQPGQGSVDSADWRSGFASLFVDPTRDRLLEPMGADLLVYSAANMRLTMIASPPGPGQMVALDPVTDQVYFLQRGMLVRRPAGTIKAPVPQPATASAPPGQPLRSLIAVPGIGQETFLFGVWQTDRPAGECWAFNQSAGELFVSSDLGQEWLRPTAGMDSACGTVTTVAVSPGFARDRTAWAGLVGLGLVRTIDGGSLWQPAGVGLESRGWRQLWYSPAYPADRTLLAQSVSGGVYHSTDGGNAWRRLEERPYSLALSPEFGQDRTLMGAFFSASGSVQKTQIRLSRDAGQTWEVMSEGVEASRVQWMGLAPLFGRWHVAFVWTEVGSLLRSSDGGAHWDTVLRTPPPAYDPFASSPPLAFAPGPEEQRTLYLVAARTEMVGDREALRGTLFRSLDGGLTWGTVRLPEGVQPTAIALSPHYLQDGLLFVGTADGRVLTLNASGLAPQ